MYLALTVIHPRPTRVLSVVLIKRGVQSSSFDRIKMFILFSQGLQLLALMEARAPSPRRRKNTVAHERTNQWDTDMSYHGDAPEPAITG